MQAGSSWTRVGGRDRAELYELGLPAARTLLAYAPGVERVRTQSVTDRSQEKQGQVEKLEREKSMGSHSFSLVLLQ